MTDKIPADLASLTEAAAQARLNKSTVSRYLRAGELANYGTASRPMVSVTELMSSQANKDPAKRRKPMIQVETAAATISHSVDRSLAEERIGKTRAERLRVERENAVQEGLLVERLPVEDAGFEMGVKLRELLDTRIPGLVQKILGETDQRSLHRMITESDHALLNEFQKYISKLLAETFSLDDVAA